MKTFLTISALAFLALAIPTSNAHAAPARYKEKAHQSRNAPHQRVAYFHPIGHRVTSLPRGHTRITAGRRDYFYHGGHFYRPSRSAYVIVAAPIGARVRTLPSGYVSFGIGTRRYHYVNATFLLWDRERAEYVVVEEPGGAAEAMKNAVPEEPTRLFIYPKQGQSPEQTDRDRYECHLWAASESGYDPTYPDQPLALLSDYNRAMSACLDGRGYTVK